MKNKLISALISVTILLSIAAVPILSFAEKEYIYLDIPGLESYNRIALSMAHRYGIKMVAQAKEELPFFEGENAVKLTAAAPEEGVNRIEFATCRVLNSVDASGFTDGVKTDIAASGKNYSVFGELTPADSDGMRIYIAAGNEGSVYIPSGNVCMQFSFTPSKGKSTSESYAEYEEGFVFETAKFPVGSDGYAYVDYEGIKPIDSVTPKEVNFLRDYLPKVNAVNIIFTPEAKISDGDFFYIGDLDVYRKAADYSIRSTNDNVCGKEAYIVASSCKDGSLSLLLDGKKLPEYIEQVRRYDNYGNSCIDVTLDTDYIGEGYHTLSLILNGEKVCEESICFDATPPTLKFSSISDGSVAPSSGVISLEGADMESGVASVSATLDNAAIILPYTYTGLSDGTHIVRYTITDAAGNVFNGNITFAVGGISFGGLAAGKDGFELEVSGLESQTVTLYSVEGELPVTSYTNSVSLSELSQKTPDGESVAQLSGSKLVSRDERYPYLAYDVDVSGYTEETVFLTFTGAANIGETLLLSAYSEKNGGWQELDRTRMEGGSLSLSASVAVADYAADGKIKCRVSLLSVDNGADSFAWTTDGQHAIEHNYEDGSYRDYTFYLEEQNEWFVEEYNKGNIGYVINTGDIANQGGDESQYAEAREINNILENANIPNGVLPGNHDMDWNNSNFWIYWQKYFGSQYYENSDWYGGKIDDTNKLHYDLVTIGGRDMIFMCASFGLDKNNQKVYDWIINTLNMYPDRTAVFCTHSYIGVEGDLTSDGGIEWWKNVVSKCPTICLVLCGHEPGSASNIRLTDDGRQVTELLHDYQSDWYPNWWNWGEGGWGLFRYVTFGEGSVSNRTYTASQEHYNKDYYWDYELENFTVPMNFIENNRVLEGRCFAAMKPDTATEVASATVKNGKAVFDGPLSEGLYYAVCGEKASGIISLGSFTANPVITSAKGYNGRLHLTWGEATQKADSYVVYVDGKEYAVVSGNETSFVSAAEYECNDICSVAIAAVYSDGRMNLSQIHEVKFVGAGKFSYGDIDNSGTIDVADALSALRMAVGLSEGVTVEQWLAADIDTDGETTVSDALNILRTAAGVK